MRASPAVNVTLAFARFTLTSEDGSPPSAVRARTYPFGIGSSHHRQTYMKKAPPKKVRLFSYKLPREGSNLGPSGYT